MEQLKQKISPEVYESLITANIRSLTTLMLFSKIRLAQITHVNINTIEEVLNDCVTIILDGKISSASLLPKPDRISVGCPTIDAIINGGISLRGISEIVGCSGVGKTQLCMQLAIMTQLPQNLGGIGKSVVYICTEDVFPVKRFIQLAAFFTNKYNNGVKICFQDNVFIEHIADIEQFKKCLFNNLPKLLSAKTVGLVVVDSIAGIFRSENQNVNYSKRSQDFIAIVTKLTKLSEKYGFAAVCINQVTDNVATGVTEPCLGLAWSNLIAFRYNISRYNKNQIREFEVVFAPDSPNGRCKFFISQEGIVAID